MEALIQVFRDLDTSQTIFYVVGGVVVVVVSTALLGKRRRPCKVIKKDFPQDTVILHQLKRGPYAPSTTPFAIKLETYLRMARIPYRNKHGYTMSSKGKVPWIEYSGESVADSTLCIDFLNKKLDIDLNKHLRPAEKGIAQSMQVMVEEHLYWMCVLFRWHFDNDKTLWYKTFNTGKFICWYLRRNIAKITWAQGLGRHTEREITYMMKKDLQSLADFIGVYFKCFVS